MNTANERRGVTFKEQELAGWTAKAGAYDDYAGRITTQLVEPLLDAAEVKPGKRVLDVACGPGYLAGAATKRGAAAVGVDFAPPMVAEAKKNFPRAAFQHGDAEALAFGSGEFDAVLCGFGLGHLADPNRAIAEAFRVLRPGGRYAFSWWCSPEKHEFFGLVFNAVKTHGSFDVPLPPAPPMFRFCDPAECKRALADAKFTDVAVQEHALTHRIETPQQVLDLIYKSSVRTAMVLELQTQEARVRIHDAILAGIEKKKGNARFKVGWPAVVVSAARPS